MATPWNKTAWTLGMVLLASTAQAQTASAVRKTVESSMLVTGQIQIAADGHVQQYTVDAQDKLPPEALKLLGQAIPSWTFEPITRQGVPVAAHSKMSLRLVASKVEQGYRMRVGSAQFTGDPQPGQAITQLKKKPPVYPVSAARAGASGIVFLVLQFGQDGKVMHVDAEQTNLTVVSNARDMANWRAVFERAAVSAATDWTFSPPTAGAPAQDAHWTIRVPVQFSMGRAPEYQYGQWQTYIPGPRNLIHWMSPQLAGDSGLDAGQPGQLSQVGDGPQLRTPLGAG